MENSCRFCVSNSSRLRDCMCVVGGSDMWGMVVCSVMVVMSLMLVMVRFCSVGHVLIVSLWMVCEVMVIDCSGQVCMWIVVRCGDDVFMCFRVGQFCRWMEWSLWLLLWTEDRMSIFVSLMELRLGGSLFRLMIGVSWIHSVVKACKLVRGKS